MSVVLGLATDTITAKPYILQKFSFKWICCKCLALKHVKEKSASNLRKKMRSFFSFKYQKFSWKSKNFSVTLCFKVVHWSKNYIFYLIRFEVQPQVREILRPSSQWSPLPEVRHNAIWLQISEKTSRIVEPKFLISSIHIWTINHFSYFV